ncbi:MAG TPA: hypothetical protein VK689_00995, partial [Armatimonadota bacterium]|nr:hypothetical protein [Armatimonadota bacterium]
GSLSVVTADLFNWNPDQPVDVICNLKSLQGFPAEDQRTLAARFYDWLTPGGYCLVQTQNVQGEARDILEGAFLDVGFFLRGEK